MFVVVIDAPRGTCGFGLFAGELDAIAWGGPISELLDPDCHTVSICPVAVPFDLAQGGLAAAAPAGGIPTSRLPPGHQRVAARHSGQGADGRAFAYLVQLRDPNQAYLSGVVGLFSGRDAAAGWWQTQERFIAGPVEATVIPVVPPWPLPPGQAEELP